MTRTINNIVTAIVVAACMASACRADLPVVHREFLGDGVVTAKGVSPVVIHKPLGDYMTVSFGLEVTPSSSRDCIRGGGASVKTKIIWRDEDDVTHQSTYEDTYPIEGQHLGASYENRDGWTLVSASVVSIGYTNYLYTLDVHTYAETNVTYNASDIRFGQTARITATIEEDRYSPGMWQVIHTSAEGLVTTNCHYDILEVTYPVCNSTQVTRVYHSPYSSRAYNNVWANNWASIESISESWVDDRALGFVTNREVSATATNGYYISHFDLGTNWYTHASQFGFDYHFPDERNRSTNYTFTAVALPQTNLPIRVRNKIVTRNGRVVLAQ